MRTLALLILLPALATAQPVRTDSVYTAAEGMPEIVGGPEALAAALTYPDEAVREGAEGTVVVRLVVGTDGVPSEAEVLRSPAESLSRAALAALDSTRFTPATIGGVPVAVRMTLPIRFRLPVAASAPVRLLVPPRESDAVEETPPHLIGGLQGLQTRVEYPVAARRRGIQGQVVVRMTVTAEGAVRDATVLRPVHPLLDAAALEAARRSRFEPATRDGVAVEVEHTVPITFRLR